MGNVSNSFSGISVSAASKTIPLGMRGLPDMETLPRDERLIKPRQVPSEYRKFFFT
ncbi:MAG TPA: hypothetical protein VLL97_14165 [Acidobacteriota bacterium]|nr:hypothetical protein [Acidobacteriota bacterium]